MPAPPLRASPDGGRRRVPCPASSSHHRLCSLVGPPTFPSGGEEPCRREEDVRRLCERGGMALAPSLLLFVPADRPERFGKALASGATGAILDLEDAVAPDRKAYAREQVRAFLDAHDDLTNVAVRVNPAETPDGRADLAMLAGARTAGAVVIPKA